jgi:hypothetical protein
MGVVKKYGDDGDDGWIDVVYFILDVSVHLLMNSTIRVIDVQHKSTTTRPDVCVWAGVNGFGTN